jgi:hypothetical protein
MYQWPSADQKRSRVVRYYKEIRRFESAESCWGLKLILFVAELMGFNHCVGDKGPITDVKQIINKNGSASGN